MFGSLHSKASSLIIRGIWAASDVLRRLQWKFGRSIRRLSASNTSAKKPLHSLLPFFMCKLFLTWGFVYGSGPSCVISTLEILHSVTNFNSDLASSFNLRLVSSWWTCLAISLYFLILVNYFHIYPDLDSWTQLPELLQVFFSRGTCLAACILDEPGYYHQICSAWLVGHRVCLPYHFICILLPLVTSW